MSSNSAFAFDSSAIDSSLSTVGTQSSLFGDSSLTDQFTGGAITNTQLSTSPSSFGSASDSSDSDDDDELIVQQPEPSVFDDDDELIDQQAELTNETNMDNNDNASGVIEVKTSPEISAVSKLASHKNFTILVNLKGLTNAISSRAPIDLVTVLDVSDSMRGDKLKLLKRAMEFVIQNLGPSDRLSVVTFSAEARRLLPLCRMTVARKQEALEVVNNLTTDYSTNIGDGLEKGVKIMTDRKWKNQVVSIILLSDGQDNCSESCNYQDLLPTTVQSQGGDGLRIPVHAFGFGADHDAAALHSISEGSGGIFSFIEAENAIQDAFAQCIGGLLSVVAQELEVAVECVDPKIRLGSIKSGSYKSHMSPNSRQGYIKVGDLFTEEERDFLVIVDDIPVDSNEMMSLLRVDCLYKDPITKKAVILKDENVLKISRPEVTGDLTVSIEVDRQRNRLRAVEVMADAKAAAENGNLGSAVSMLEGFHKSVLESVSAEDPLCIGLAAEVRKMQDRMGSQNDYESAGRAYFLSAMSSHSSQRASCYGVGQMYGTSSMANMVNKSKNG